MAIEAEHYEKTRQTLMADPIVIDMAGGLARVPLEKLQHDDGTPRFQFIQQANAEFAERRGVGAKHIGAVAEALLRLVKAAR